MRQRRRTARSNQSQDVLNLSAVPIPLSISIAIISIPTKIDKGNRYITQIQNSLTLGSPCFIFINITYVCINIYLLMVDY